jgi:hypothetical protein
MLTDSTIDCPNCEIVVAHGDTTTAAGIKMCAGHKSRADQRSAHARATNPDVAAVHAMIAAHRAQKSGV